MVPTFLSLDEVLLIHQDQIRRYGGQAGLRDRGLLQSALGAPQASFGGSFLHESLPEMASAYLYSIAKNHPFLDGNKRTALASMLVFLGFNGWALESNNDALFDLVVGVAAGNASKADVAVFVQSHAAHRQ